MKGLSTYDFLWRVCEDGYQWLNCKYFSDGLTHKTSSTDLKGPEWMLTSGKKFGQRYLETRYDPLKLHPTLFRTFGELAESNKEAILGFVNKYGPLGEQKALYQETPDNPKKLEIVWGERLLEWSMYIREMKWALQVWDWVQSGEITKLAHHIRWYDNEFDVNGNQLRMEGWGFLSHPDEPLLSSVPGKSMEYIAPTPELSNKQDVVLPALFLIHAGSIGGWKRKQVLDCSIIVTLESTCYSLCLQHC